MSAIPDLLLLLPLLMAPTQGSCGATRRYFEPLPTPQAIINGHEVFIYDYPFLVYLANVNTNLVFCGGSIINRWAILTAGHCISELDPLDFLVVAGYNAQGRNIQIRDAKRTTLHPKFNQMVNTKGIRVIDYDYGVVHLEEALHYDLSVSFVKLSKSWKYVDENTEFFTMGWGDTRPKSYVQPSKIRSLVKERNGTRRSSNFQFRMFAPLKGIALYMQNFESCRKNYSSEDILVTERFFCASSMKGDTCSGDSGGPVLVGKVQYGLTSFALGCYREGFPSAYAKTPLVYDWIMATARAAGRKLNVLIFIFVILFYVI